jgi:hypothetical protein
LGFHVCWIFIVFHSMDTFDDLVETRYLL